MGLKGLALTLLFITIASFRYMFIDTTTFDLSYKIYKKEIKYDTNPNIHFLYCKNELGNFKIDVSDETYKNHKVNDNIRYSKPFTSHEIYRYAVDEKSEKNVVNAVNGFEKILIQYVPLQMLLFIFSFMGLIFLMPILSRILNE